MNHLKTLRHKLQKKKTKFITEHKFKSADELPFSRKELANAVELNQAISVMNNGQLQLPTFQFGADGQVYQTLQRHLPRLLDCRSGWDICFWLFTEHAVILKMLKPDARQLKNSTLDEVLRIADRAAELTETCVAKPIDLVITGNNEAFTAFIENWLTPDLRNIPAPEIPEGFWESFFDEKSTKTKYAKH